MYKKLKELRLKNEYTSQMMADKLKISKSFYSQIETGTRKLTYKRAIQIANIFNKKPDYIFYDDEINEK